MKNIALFSLYFLISIPATGQQDIKHLVCGKYWSEVSFSDLCGITADQFEFNSIPNDICNADLRESAGVDDRISIRVYNHFTLNGAQDEYGTEKEDYQALDGYQSISNLGDDALVLWKMTSGRLDHATLLVWKETYTISLEVNLNPAQGANNCLDQPSIIELARALVKPL